MQKTRKNILVFIILIVFVGIVTYVLYSAGFTKKVLASIENLKGEALLEQKVYSKPEILTIINTSGEKKVNEDVVLFIDVLSDSNVKIEYSYDMKKWKSVNDVTKDNDVYTGRMVFKKNIQSLVYFRAINEQNKVSDYKKTKVIIDK